MKNLTKSYIHLIEDHDLALKVWRDKKVFGLDLVHIDAHMDFVIPQAKSINTILDEAKNLQEIKKGLEYSIAFLSFEKNLDTQTDIGNYIYPAVEEGIVRNFYWVVPGKSKEFLESIPLLQKTLKGLLKRSGQRPVVKRQKIKNTDEVVLSTKFKGREIVICTLDTLPVFEHPVLLDIDTDFLVFNSLKNVDSTRNIKKRKPWIQPQELTKKLKEKIKHPLIITIAYSVNGGYTPMIYKHYGDEIAYFFAPDKFKTQYKTNSLAARHFNLFLSTGKKEHYLKAMKLNPTYRAADNNYGPLYLSLRKLSLAQEEFKKILEVDPRNPACLWGFGEIAFARKDYIKAKHYFSFVLSTGEDPLFDKIKTQGLWGSAKTEYALKNFKKAKELLFRHKAIKALHPKTYYLLGRILEREKDYTQAAKYYKDSIRLGFRDIEPIERLVKISPFLREKNGIIKFAQAKHKEFKKRFLKIKKTQKSKNKKMLNLSRVEKKLQVLEKNLYEGR